MTFDAPSSDVMMVSEDATKELFSLKELTAGLANDASRTTVPMIEKSFLIILNAY